MTPERIAEIRQAIQKYGPSNAWTGTTGTLAGMLHELLAAFESQQKDHETALKILRCESKAARDMEWYHAILGIE